MATTTVRVYPPYHEEMVAVEVELVVDGRTTGRLRARRGDQRETPLVFRLPPGFHRYDMRGESSLTSSRRVALEGAGTLAHRRPIEEELAGAAQPLAVLERLLAEYRHAAGPPASLPRLERQSASVPSQDVPAAEERLGIRLPPAYPALLARYGPFTLVGLNDEDAEEPLAALYAPAELHPVAEWRRRVRHAPLGEGDTPAARAALAEMARDVVIGHTLDTVWTARAGTHPPCPDGSTSLSGAFLYEVRAGEDLYNEATDSYAGYFGNREPRCGDHSTLLREHFAAALAEGFRIGAALVGADDRLRATIDADRSTPERFWLTLG
jgi:hypothetical protein